MDITVSGFMKGRYNLILYISIDITKLSVKLNHFVFAISSNGEILIKLFKFTNDYDSFYLLLSKLDPFEPHSIIIGLESTAHYKDNHGRFLITKNYRMRKSI